MFKWFNPENFMDTYQEWHALVVGFCEVLCPWPPRHKPSPENEKDIADEYPYYMWGRSLGIAAWLTIGCVIKVVLF
jgi:hypothetical protein